MCRSTQVEAPGPCGSISCRSASPSSWRSWPGFWNWRMRTGGEKLCQNTPSAFGKVTSPEDQSGAKAGGGERLGLAGAMIGQDCRVTHELTQRCGEAFEIVGTLQQIASAQRADYALADLAVDAFAADQLQVLVSPVLLDADEHGVASLHMSHDR